VTELRVIAVDGLPEIAAGDRLGQLIGERAELEDGDVVAISQKVVSKSEDRIVELAEVEPSPRATELAAELGKEPALVQLVLDESRAVLRAERGVLICETRHGFVCANAGVDASNAPDDDTVILLPVDPDRSARALRAGVRERLGVAPAVLITDSFGRAWRTGQCDVAIGCAGLTPLDDWRGRTDIRGRELRATVIAVADQLAAAADLARAKDAMQPAVLVSGAGRHVTAEDGLGALPLLRESASDLFR
jgi:coenzyme F420-0:L-glutamate ligase / coenzyme F420-1:gamma-L-glutamate ligase